jgi:release factor glutamine methyltransferase
MDTINLNSILKEAAERLCKVGIDAGEAEAEIILCHLLLTERLEMYLEGAGKITEDTLAKFEEIIKRRETRYPLQFILGEQYFYGRRFFVNEAVMIPTPETELLCENAVRYLSALSSDHPALSDIAALDIGTGAGVIAVTVALEAPQCNMTALDISAEALEVARKNADDLGVDKIEFRESDLFSAVLDSEKFDLILSNPPYIADGEYEGLPPEVKADPRIALTSGDRGLDIIEKLIDQAPMYLKAGGKFMFEIGYDQAEWIAEIIDRDERYRSHVLFKDLNDIDRMFILSIH